MQSKYRTNNYREGDTVNAIVHPEVKLVIRRYEADIYYCTIKEHPEQKELVYFERELESKG